MFASPKARLQSSSSSRTLTRPSTTPISGGCAPYTVVVLIPKQTVRANAHAAPSHHATHYPAGPIALLQARSSRCSLPGWTPPVTMPPRASLTWLRSCSSGTRARVAQDSALDSTAHRHILPRRIFFPSPKSHVESQLSVLFCMSADFDADGFTQPRSPYGRASDPSGSLVTARTTMPWCEYQMSIVSFSARWNAAAPE